MDKKVINSITIKMVDGEIHRYSSWECDDIELMDGRLKIIKDDYITGCFAPGQWSMFSIMYQNIKEINNG